jgi:hypothetical protein
MNPATVVAILQMILEAEPVVVQTVHDLLVGTGGQSDQEVLTADLADWNAIIEKARAQMPAA